MRLFILGKLGSIVHWVEDSLSGFRAAGHQVELGVTRNPRLSPAIERLLPRPATIARHLRRFRPDLIVAIVPHAIPAGILHRVAAMPGRPPLIAWIGDAFTADDRPIADLFDAVAYTDTGMLALHRQFGFRAPCAFVPHAARAASVRAGVMTRRPHMVFVANPTSHRRDVVARVTTPLKLIGPAWSHPAIPMHEIEDRRVPAADLPRIYATHVAVLNIRNEVNVLNGLNQRHFEPALSATPVVSDAQPDLDLCFDPGKEVLVYQDTDELNALYDRLHRDPTFAAAIGRAAQKRVEAHHGYAQRLTALAAMVSLVP
jgi:spore maturation protein CgeB